MTQVLSKAGARTCVVKNPWPQSCKVEVHCGGAAGGHYVAVTTGGRQGGDGAWDHCSDSSVRRVGAVA